MSGIARSSLGLLILTALVAGACEPRKYEEREVKIVVPTAGPDAPGTGKVPVQKQRIVPAREPEGVISREVPKAFT